MKNGMLIMLAFSFFDSSAGLFIKLLEWNPFVIAGLRGLLTFFILFFFYRTTGTGFAFSRRSFPGGFIISAMFVTFIAATKITTAANAALLQYSNPAFIIIFSGIFFKQKPSPADIGVILCTFTGMSFIFSGSMTGNNIAGDILAVTSGAAFAGMFVFNSHVQSGEDHIGAILLGHIITFACCVPFLFLSPPELSLKSVRPLFAMVIFQQVIPFILYAKAIRICPPLAASLVTMTGPVLNSILVWIFIGEVPGFLAIVGGVIIMLSIGIWTIITLEKNSKLITEAS